MSWAEDMGIDWGDSDLIKESHDCNWVYLKHHGFIWQDRSGRVYKADDISDNYLQKIINFCERNYRPSEQIKALKSEAMKRGMLDE